MSDVQHVMAEEHKQTALRKAEMEANKASVRRTAVCTQHFCPELYSRAPSCG